MFKFIKKITGPIVFAKGVAQFRQHQHKIAKQLFTKSVQWMPRLQSDPLYLALAHLCDHHLGTNQDGCTETLQNLLDTLVASPHKDTVDYRFAATEIRDIIGSMR